jgi:hypothetical protein
VARRRSARARRSRKFNGQPCRIRGEPHGYLPGRTQRCYFDLDPHGRCRRECANTAPSPTDTNCQRHAREVARRLRRAYHAHISSTGSLVGSAGSFTPVYQAGPNGVTSVSVPTAAGNSITPNVDVGSWTLLVYTPSYIGPAGPYGTWGGYATFFADSGNPAWNQVCTKAQDLIAVEGWVDATNFNCSPSGSNTEDTNSNTDSTLFQITVCNRWFTIFGYGRVLLTGGWQSGGGRAPGVEVRCP